MAEPLPESLGSSVRSGADTRPMLEQAMEAGMRDGQVTRLCPALPALRTLRQVRV